MIRGIPPRTMSNRGSQGVRRLVLRLPGGLVPRGLSRQTPSVNRAPDGAAPAVTPVRTWRYQTKPVFKRVASLHVDIFDEAEEIWVVVDLGGFTRGEIFRSLGPGRYVVEARRGDERFSEVIELPDDVDVDRAQERFANGVLELVLPRRTPPGAAGP